MLNEKNKHYIVAFCLILLLFFLQFLGLLNLSWFSNLANQLKAQNFAVLSQLNNPLQRLTLMWNLTANLEDLQYRYSEAAVAFSKVEALEKENQELRRILENSDRSYNQVTVAAPIISFAQTFIAVGAKDGIKPGSAVLYKGTLLGLVDSVEEKQSLVTLLNKLHGNSILVKTNKGVKGLLAGNGREIILSEVSINEPLEVGDLVFTAASLGIEDGLLIGRITHISAENQALATKTAVVEQLVNFYEVGLVEIK